MSEQEVTAGSGTQEQPDPGQLAEMVKGLSDDELDEAIRNLGVDEVLTNIFDGMQQRFIPEKAAGVECTIQYDIATDGDTKQWTVAFADGRCETSSGPAPDPRLTLQLSLVDFVRLVLGQAEGSQLFMGGKLKLQGDMMFAMQMQTFFDRDF
jgi:putative sterol carrier protein